MIKFRLALIGLCLLWPLTTLAQPAPSAGSPVMIEWGSFTLQEFGISGIAEPGDERDFNQTPHRCYTYGGDGNGIAISDALLAQFKRRGFSLESLCLALESEVRFDPETGKRLPTYVVFDRRAMLEALERHDFDRMTDAQIKACCSEEGLAHAEQPLDVPVCFKDGAPYSDCAWRYDVVTGRKLSDAETRRYRDLGRAIEAGMTRAMKGEIKACGGKAVPSDDIDVRWPCKPARARSDTGFLQPDAKFVVDLIKKHVDAGLVPQPLTRINKATFVDISPAFPRGYGYALMAEENGGPSINEARLLRRLRGEVRSGGRQPDAAALGRHARGE